jgi:methionine synthase II (cobalamin-independent)
MAPTLLRNPPHRAEHIGSLKRPQKLLDARGESDHPKATPEEIKKLEDESIKDAVAKQLEWGFSTITDGEYR